MNLMPSGQVESSPGNGVPYAETPYKRGSAPVTIFPLRLR